VNDPANRPVHGSTKGPLVVVGDSLLDVDLEGSADRLAPDAPVPVVDVTREWQRPGGAGLAALLAARSGHEVVLVTAIGADESADRLRGLLGGLVEVVALPLVGGTSRKTRVLANGVPASTWVADGRSTHPSRRPCTTPSTGPARCSSPTTAGA